MGVGSSPREATKRHELHRRPSMSARHLVVLSVLAASALVAPNAASAGTYDVAACDPTIAAGANNAFAPVAEAA
jgi:hypothetical protein